MSVLLHLCPLRGSGARAAPADVGGAGAADSRARRRSAWELSCICPVQLSRWTCSWAEALATRRPLKGAIPADALPAACHGRWAARGLRREGQNSTARHSAVLKPGVFRLRFASHFECGNLLSAKLAGAKGAGQRACCAYVD